MQGARQAAEELLTSDAGLAAALDPQVVLPAWRRRQALDRLVRAVSKAGLDRAHHPFDEQIADWPSAPRLPKRTRIEAIDAQQTRGYLYGLVDGAFSRLDWYASFDGWEDELTADFRKVFGCDVPPGTFEYDDTCEADDLAGSRLRRRLRYDADAWATGYWQAQDVGEEVLGIAASLYVDAGGDFEQLDSVTSMIPASQIARRVLHRLVDLLSHPGG